VAQGGGRTLKLPDFEYHSADTVADALEMLSQLGDDAKILAGGQSLIPLMAFRLSRPAHLIDINRVEGLARIQGGTGVTLGALVRHGTAEHSAITRQRTPLVTEALGYVGHAAIRNRGTVGGSIAHADPAAELPAVLMALGGEIVARSVRGIRVIAAEAFFTGFLSTDLEPDELLVELRIPGSADAEGWSFNEVSRRDGDFAVVGVAARVRLDGKGRIRSATLVFSGVGSTPVKAVEAVAVMLGELPSAQLWEEAADRGAREVDPRSDLHGSGEYRRHLVKTLTRRSLQTASCRARGSEP
jgi:carbon-monoxide dehydrogenase medium subunit